MGRFESVVNKDPVEEFVEYKFTVLYRVEMG